MARICLGSGYDWLCNYIVLSVWFCFGFVLRSFGLLFLYELLVSFSEQKRRKEKERKLRV